MLPGARRRVDTQLLATRQRFSVRLLDRMHEFMGKQAAPLIFVRGVASTIEHDRPADRISERADGTRRRNRAFIGVYPYVREIVPEAAFHQAPGADIERCPRPSQRL